MEYKTEATLQQSVRIEASESGGRLWRNNTGAATDDNGRLIRFGLCNESAKVNAKIKSSDLIGLRPIVITEDMVGKTFGQFVAIETKKPGWRYTGTKRERAQKKFIDLVISLGGWAKFTDKSFYGED